MTALQYLESLIQGQKLSTIPVQNPELEFLKALLIQEQQAKK